PLAPLARGSGSVVNTPGDAGPTSRSRPAASAPASHGAVVTTAHRWRALGGTGCVRQIFLGGHSGPRAAAPKLLLGQRDDAPTAGPHARPATAAREVRDRTVILVPDTGFHDHEEAHGPVEYSSGAEARLLGGLECVGDADFLEQSEEHVLAHRRPGL